MSLNHAGASDENTFKTYKNRRIKYFKEYLLVLVIVSKI